MWATLVLAVVAIGLVVWALSERSDADDAQAALAAHEEQAAKATPTPTATPEADDGGVSAGAVAAAVAAFTAGAKALNESDARIEDLEAEVDKANAAADEAEKEAQQAKAEASTATDAKQRAQAEADQAEADQRALEAKGEAAAACAKAIVQTLGEVPDAEDPEQALNDAGAEITALVPKCKESVASAGG